MGLIVWAGRDFDIAPAVQDLDLAHVWNGQAKVLRELVTRSPKIPRPVEGGIVGDFVADLRPNSTHACGSQSDENEEHEKNDAATAHARRCLPFATRPVILGKLDDSRDDEEYR